MNENLVLVKESRLKYLEGMDDGHPFRVQVSAACKTVDDAVKWLRPKGCPDSATRQGEWFFVKCYNPPSLTNGWEYEGGMTDSGSYAERRVFEISTFDRNHRHVPDECRVLQRRGRTAFRGRRSIKTHAWEARPRIFVRGWISHPEHGDCYPGDGWFEVIPNRAHGPFAVGSINGGLD